MITNDVKNVEMLPSLYSLFLNPAGRVLYDLILYKICDTEYLVEYDATGIEYVHKHLTMYRLRKNVQIEPSSDMSVWVIYKQNNAGSTDENFDLEDIYNHLNKISDIVKYTQDPRNNNLGIRIITKKDTNLPKFLELSGLNLLKTGCYQLLRYQLGIGEGVLDHPPGNCLPFETNVDLLNGVSFTKGCYIGQEMTAKSNFVFSVRKRLMPVIFEEMNSYPIFPPECNILNDKQKKMGRLRTRLGQHGLGLLKFEDCMKSNFLQLQGYDIKLKAIWPNWWPKSLSSNKNEHIFSL
ncbi:putative transferase CAF17 homolog, mitochondrial [Nephila pilipes]|uniref:Putative transferase CAF17 homolog, mitochondrial n=1 Tax=Nephila pilipes TaxID=299642 RepID=A0A8X6Q2X8_NEPPI|nr:putative transferase CAF17 homolog, mitochondrial [Nephila pilipes]